MNNCETIVIDLSNSFTLADHCTLANTVIEIDSDESFDSNTVTNVENSKPKRSSKKKDGDTNSNSHAPSKRSKKDRDKVSNKFGECAICWDELGKNPLASTKCGHVYCLKCLEKSLQIEKRCPMCRSSLKGKQAYHPLYLNK